MSKQRKKLRCVCKGQPERTHEGTDRQRHVSWCPLAVKNKKN